MSDFIKNKIRSGSGEDKEVVIGKLQDITHSPEKGRQRIYVRPKPGFGKTVAVDIKSTEVQGLKRNQTYKFELEEKDTAAKYGQERSRFSSQAKSYRCNDAPELWNKPAGMDSRWSRFGGGTSQLQ